MDRQAVLAVARGTVAIQRFYRALFGYENIDTEFAVDATGAVLRFEVRTRAANSGGPGGPTGPLRTPSGPLAPSPDTLKRTEK